MLNNQIPDKDLSHSAGKSYLSYDFIKGSAKRYELMWLIIYFFIIIFIVG